MTVVASIKLDDLAPPRVTSGQPDGAHCGLGAGINHPYHFHGGNQFGNHLGQLNFQRSGNTEAETAVQLLF